MIKSAEITNFRCFERTKLDKCRRVNVIVGKNATGKTALLEALFLAVGPSPEIVTRFRLWRGYEQAVTGTFEQIEESIWSDLFFRYDLGCEINVKLHGAGKYNRSLSIRFDRKETFVPVTKEEQPADMQSAIEFNWLRSDATHHIIRPRFTGSGYQFPGLEKGAINTAFFASSHPFPNVETVRRFSELSGSRREGPLIEAIKREFDFIDTIEIQSHAGISMLHADIPWLPKKVPLSAVSSGVNKFTILLLAIAEHKKSAIFVDEIENGFHYSRYESIWRSFLQFCDENEVQLFTTTHSHECLEALAAASKENPNAVSLIRTDLKDGIAHVEQFVGVKAAQFGEVR